MSTRSAVLPWSSERSRHMSVAVHRTFVTLVLALVAALVMPLAAGAVVLPDELVATDEVDGAPVVEEIDRGLLEEPTPVELPDAVSPPPPHALTPDDEQEVVASATEDEEITVADLESPDETDVSDAPEHAKYPTLSTAASTGRDTHIAAGHSHGLYLDSKGQIWAWGLNSSGQLGNGTRASSTTPVPVDMTGVMANSEMVAVAAGARHSLALDSEGNVFAWGRNGFGELGDGTRVDRSTPVRVGGLLAEQPVERISGGGNTTDAGIQGNSLALGANGRVYTWGAGERGRLGIGTSPASIATPALVGGLIADQHIVDASFGTNNAVVLSSDGRLFSWGDGSYGALGNGTTTTSASPVAVTMTGVLSGVSISQVDAGQLGSIARSVTGELFTWGWNNAGQIGNGTTSNSTVPTRVDMGALEALGNRPIQASAGPAFYMALGADGRLAAWGLNTSGQLGAGTNVNASRPVAVRVDGVMVGANIIQVTNSSSGTTLALADDGRVFAWGIGGSGGLGNGSSSNANAPVQVGGLRTTIQPEDIGVTEGDDAKFMASSNELTATVQWQSSTDGGHTWAPIIGEISSDLIILATTREMTGTQFRAVFTSASPFPNTVVSRAATLTVQELEDPPLITLHPVNRVRSLVDLEVTLTADAVSPTPMTVQWQSSADDGSTWVDLVGATDKTHTFVATEDLDGALFRAVFTNPAGAATTDSALLQVVLRAPQAHLSVTPTTRLVTEPELA
ncbi:RCC1 domain-containing protein, alpha-tubulin suppressor [Sanguibacter keddieii DSM 10542]|uniref:RCC1 domain-containing protein, alpha-tubulin suppressor n=2 Tax=Sanguibacter keddieii TaxID=60920 RepID=D1BAP6_SANKS|nr:RCC1 domain-containing protein, alpha-tubulin suppressor [Sanguibacter keddieii DSM 10542]